MISDFDIIPLLRRTGIVDRGEVAAAIKFSELEALFCSSMLFTSSLPKLSVASIDMFEGVHGGLRLLRRGILAL